MRCWPPCRPLRSRRSCSCATASAMVATTRTLSLLGATGSVGASTLDVVAQHPDRFAVAALAAHRNAEKLATLCRRFQPRLAVLLDEDAARAMARDIANDCPATRVAGGATAL